MLYNPAMQVGFSIAIIYTNCTERAWADMVAEAFTV
jgi:hypothetical protein